MENIDFYNIRQFACEYFFAWESGEDFDWLKKEWYKFEQYLKSKKEAEDFILVLADIYNTFCHSAYFMDAKTEYNEKYSWIIENPNEEFPVDIELEKRIETSYDKTLDILLEVYTTPEEILRQFISIFIEFQIPNCGGYKYIFDLFKDKWSPDNDMIPIF